MKIAVVRETAPGETRVAATPETVKKFIGLGAEVSVEAGAGEQASVPDADFEAAGATVAPREKALSGADIILAINGPEPGSLKGAKSGAHRRRRARSDAAARHDRRLCLGRA